MKRTSQSSSPRGDARGPRRGSSSSSPGSSRPRDGRPAGGRDDRAPRGGSARAGSSAGSRDAWTPRGGSARAAASSRSREERAPRGSGDRPAAPRATQRVTTQRTAPRAPNTDVLLARQPWSGLRPLIPGAPAEVETRLAALKAYAKQLLEWNRGVSNLVSRHDEPRIVDRHLRESLFAANLLVESGCRRFVDFGSGAGLPAVPLVLCGVGEHWTLVESRRNKTLFLRKVQQDNGFKNFDVLTGRLEVLAAEEAERLACDGFTSRATATIGPTLVLAAKIVTTGGKAFLWKGSSYEQEMESTRREWEPVWHFERAMPIADGPNVLAVFSRL